MSQVTSRILVVAPTGNHPADLCKRLPLQPGEIAMVVNACHRLGASIAHLHARDLQGIPTADPCIFQKIIKLIRSSSNDMILQASTGCASIDEILSLTTLDVEMLSLDIRRFINSKKTAQILLNKFRERKIKPELEIFNEESADIVAVYTQEGLLENPIFCNLIIPNELSYREGLFLLKNIVSRLPKGCVWVCCRGTFPLRITAATIGGNVRTGLEDILLESVPGYSDNIECFREMVQILSRLKFKPASSNEVRQILKLSSTSRG